MKAPNEINNAHCLLGIFVIGARSPDLLVSTRGQKFLSVGLSIRLKRKREGRRGHRGQKTLHKTRNRLDWMSGYNDGIEREQDTYTLGAGSSSCEPQEAREPGPSLETADHSIDVRGDDPGASLEPPSSSELLGIYRAISRFPKPGRLDLILHKLSHVPTTVAKLCKGSMSQAHWTH
jgi:hypothetical protein